MPISACPDGQHPRDLACTQTYGPCAGPWGHSPKRPQKIRKKSKIGFFRFLKNSKTHQITHESTILTPDSSPARRADTFRGVCHFLRFDFWWSHGQFTFWHFCIILLLGLSSARAPAQGPSAVLYGNKKYDKMVQNCPKLELILTFILSFTAKFKVN